MLLTLVYFVLILGTIVLVHEFGHFFFSKLFGVYVYEFSIGMGPKIWKSKKKKGKETEYSIGAIPIGGYCALAGEGSEDDKKLPKDRLLGSKPAWQRFLIMFFGAGNNFILALVVLFLLGLFCGSPSVDNKVYDIIKDSPMEIAGMKKGDEIIKIDGQKVKTLDDMQLYLTLSEGETAFTVLRDGKKIDFEVKPYEGKELEEKGYSFGIKFNTKREKGFVKAVKYAFVKFYALTRQMAITFKLLFTGGVSVKNLSGPVGIYSVVGEAKSTGFANIIYLLALLSLNVGFVNLIPFPAFDGGRILFLLIEKIKGSPVKSETENLIHTIGFFLLIGLIIFVTINDILRLF